MKTITKSQYDKEFEKRKMEKEYIDFSNLICFIIDETKPAIIISKNIIPFNMQLFSPNVYDKNELNKIITTAYKKIIPKNFSPK